MAMKSIERNNKLLFKIMKVLAGNTLLYIIKKYIGGSNMLRLLAKVAEKYAKSTNTACWVWGIMHQPKMPASLIKKD